MRDLARDPRAARPLPVPPRPRRARPDRRRSRRPRRRRRRRRINLKISKAGGLIPGRRHRDLARAAGLTVSVQDTVGSSLSYAAILHLGATVPPRSLRGVLNAEEMVTRRIAALDTVVTTDGVLPGRSPGLGATVDVEALGEPVAVWE
ncbi:enolase C-terminal domain-like protein [Actinomycetospora aeridis]|uniref:Enolase C-terminal domain-like protein n=1 Tax=Actinomycetospora aeridis TaxID=3129231 RepID=A0ABU8N416_9PSEU